MIKFLKKLLGLVIDFTIGPFIDLVNWKKQSNPTRFWSTVGALARTVIMASWLTAVSPVLVSLAWTIIFVPVYILIGFMLFTVTMLVVSLFLSAAMGTTVKATFTTNSDSGTTVEPTAAPMPA